GFAVLAGRDEVCQSIAGNTNGEMESKSGILYVLAPPYTLHVPPAFIQAVNIATPEYSWAQSLVVAMHSIKLAFGDNVTYSEIPLEQAAAELDSLRRQHYLASTTPSSKYDLADCRVLHSRDVTGPTAVAGWRNCVSGEPMIRH
ncbi:MAG: hypothetical protein ACKPKO_52315, partial [Candidatus Fonsibacter sp.]